MRLLRYSFEANGSTYVGFCRGFEEARERAKFMSGVDSHRWRREINYQEVVYKFDPTLENILELMYEAAEQSNKYYDLCYPMLESKNDRLRYDSERPGETTQRVSLGSQIQ